MTMEILGTIWILPRETREAGEAREDKPWQEQRGGERGWGVPWGDPGKGWGQRVHVMRKGGFLPPSQSLSPVGHLH